MCVDNIEVNASIFNLIAQLSLNQKIQEAQKIYLYLHKIKQLLKKEGIYGWKIHRDGQFRFQGRIYIPLSIRHELLEEAYHSKFTILQEATKCTIISKGNIGGTKWRTPYQIRGKMYDLSIGESFTPKARRIALTATNTWMEMGQYYCGHHVRITKYMTNKWYKS